MEEPLTPSNAGLFEWKFEWYIRCLAEQWNICQFIVPNDQIQHNKMGSEQIHYSRVTICCTTMHSKTFFPNSDFLLVFFFFYILVDRYVSYVITLPFTLPLIWSLQKVFCIWDYWSCSNLIMSKWLTTNKSVLLITPALHLMVIDQHGQLYMKL